jgi:cell division protease FtsH
LSPEPVLPPTTIGFPPGSWKAPATRRAVPLSTTSNDLQRATDLARRMVAQYSMSETFGLATFEEPRQTFLNVDGPASREYSEATAQAADAEIANILNAAHARVGQTLTDHRATLEALAKLLMEQEVVTADALRPLLREAAPSVAIA